MTTKFLDLEPAGDKRWTMTVSDGLAAGRGDHRFLEDRTIDVYIRRLRAGLGAAAEGCVETVRGIGYKFVPPKS